jgi:hypothetical protein
MTWADVDQRHEGVAEADHRVVAADVVHVLGAGGQAFDDGGQRGDQGLVGGGDDHAVQHRQGQRQAEGEGRALAGDRADRDAAAQGLDRALDHVHADAATRDVGDRLGGREAGQEDQVVDLLVGQDRVLGDQAARDGDALDPFAVDAAAVVADLDDDPARAVQGGQTDDALGRLAGGGAVVGRSSPWSMALRSMWVIGSARRSTTVLSTSVSSPAVTSGRACRSCRRLRGPDAACAGTPTSPAGRGWP